MNIKGQTIVYSEGDNPCPVGAHIIKASFSHGSCSTRCPHLPSIHVGSLACMQCEYFAGKQNFAISTGSNGAFGTDTETRDIYCTKETQK